MNAKHHKILIPNSVKISLQKQVDYISIECKEPLLALNWIDGMINAMQSLSKLPERCPIAPENYHISRTSQEAIRHFIYKKSFRIIFIVVKNEVRILSIKHSAQLK